MSEQNSLADIFKSAEPFLCRVRDRLSVISSQYEPKIFAPVRYALSLKGQMLRPLFVYATAQTITDTLSEIQSQKLVHFATAVELLHVASLAQDDVFDCEECRRGEVSLPKKHGNSAAILSGNLLYIAAFRELLTFGASDKVQALLNTASSMCEGELLQDSHSENSLESSIYLEIITLKTARLIAMACSETARILQVSEDQISLIDELGETAGVLYQLRDDLADNDVNVEKNSLMDQQKKRAFNLISRLNRPDLFQQFVSAFTN